MNLDDFVTFTSAKFGGKFGMNVKKKLSFKM